MRLLLRAVTAVLLPGVALAQSQPAPIVATPLPPTVQYPSPLPGAFQPSAPVQAPVQVPVQAPVQAPAGQPAPAQAPVQAPAQVPTPGPAAPAADQPGQPAAPEQPPPPPNPWLPQGGAVLQVLDKVNAQSAALTVKVGQAARFGSLTIAVQGCAVRPPDMPQDSAAYLTITDSHPDQPGFNGWILKSAPSVSMLQHPIYDVRVTGCSP